MNALREEASIVVLRELVKQAKHRSDTSGGAKKIRIADVLEMQRSHKFFNA